jgi:hypothetical protein
MEAGCSCLCPFVSLLSSSSGWARWRGEIWRRGDAESRGSAALGCLEGRYAADLKRQQLRLPLSVAKEASPFFDNFCSEEYNFLHALGLWGKICNRSSVTHPVDEPSGVVPDVVDGDRSLRLIQCCGGEE